MRGLDATGARRYNPTPNAKMLLFFFLPVKARNLAIGFGVISLYSAIFSANSQFSHLGHLGGLIGGVAYTFAILKGARQQPGEPEVDFRSSRTDFFQRKKPSDAAETKDKVLVYDPVSGKYFYEKSK